MWPVIVGCLVPSTVLAWTDYKRHWVPNVITVPMIVAGLAYAIYAGYFSDALLGAVVLFLVGLLPFLFGGMGGGDVKFMAALGAWFGLYPAVTIVFIACILGVVWGLGKKVKAGQFCYWAGNFCRGLFLRFVYNTKGMLIIPKLPDDISAPLPKEAIPFGTCLAVSTWLVFLKGVI